MAQLLFNTHENLHFTDSPGAKVRSQNNILGFVDTITESLFECKVSKEVPLLIITALLDSVLFADILSVVQ